MLCLRHDALAGGASPDEGVDVGRQRGPGHHTERRVRGSASVLSRPMCPPGQRGGVKLRQHEAAPQRRVSRDAVTGGRRAQRLAAAAVEEARPPNEGGLGATAEGGNRTPVPSLATGCQRAASHQTVVIARVSIQSSGDGCCKITLEKTPGVGADSEDHDGRRERGWRGGGESQGTNDSAASRWRAEQASLPARTSRSRGRQLRAGNQQAASVTTPRRVGRAESHNQRTSEEAGDALRASKLLCSAGPQWNEALGPTSAVRGAAMWENQSMNLL
jgi:hypothetical protein